MKVLVLTADANTLIYHRGDLIRDFAAHGCEVVTSAAEDYPHVKEFVAGLGGRHRAIRMVRSKVNPLKDLVTLRDMFRMFREEKPDALFAYTIKSVVYGCVVARLAGIRRVYALLPGLGFTFVKPVTWKQKILSRISEALHRFALKRADVIFMQNHDDVKLFKEMNMLPSGVPVHVTAGSGVNMEEYAHAPMDADEAVEEGRIRFVLVSRLLISKGVRVFAEAARRIKQLHPHAEFHLVGPFDPNPNRVEEREVQQWVAEGTLVHHGMVKDVASLLKKMHVFVLPTWYREGVPHATLEALATGRPIITTNSVGAKECVKLTAEGEQQRASGEMLMQGENGFLCQPQNVAAVECAMEWYLAHHDQIVKQGHASRQLAAEVFDVRLVNEIILKAMNLQDGTRCATNTRCHTPSPLPLAA